MVVMSFLKLRILKTVFSKGFVFWGIFTNIVNTFDYYYN